jgi:hypothetical protein
LELSAEFSRLIGKDDDCPFGVSFCLVRPKPAAAPTSSVKTSMKWIFFTQIIIRYEQQ